MVGDVEVFIKIYGPNGDKVALTRQEAVRCLNQLRRALKTTRQPVAKTGANAQKQKVA